MSKVVFPIRFTRSGFASRGAAVGRVVSFHGCEPPFMGGFFQAAQAAKGGLGVATPTRFPQDKIERLAKFGTVVESCS